MGISCRVLLWLKEGVKVPERTLDKIVCWHFRETSREKKSTTLQPLTYLKMYCDHKKFNTMKTFSLHIRLKPTDPSIPIPYHCYRMETHLVLEWDPAHPISRKICLISARTFMRGWRWPQGRAAPNASKLYALKCFVFQEPLCVRVCVCVCVCVCVWPCVRAQREDNEDRYCKEQTKRSPSHLCIISGVSSASCLTTSVENSAPFLTTKHLVTLAEVVLGEGKEEEVKLLTAEALMDIVVSRESEIHGEKSWAGIQTQDLLNTIVRDFYH